jgi:hypothetical protein
MTQISAYIFVFCCSDVGGCCGGVGGCGVNELVEKFSL